MRAIRVALLTAAALTLTSPAFAKCPEPIARALLTRVQLVAAERCPCDTAPSRKAYLQCFRQVVKEAVADASLPRSCKGQAMRIGTRSTCGRPGAVTCCIVTPKGREVCRVKPSPGECRPSRAGGSATVGSSASCFDACLTTPPLPDCNALTRTDEQIAAAVDLAITSFEAQGFVIDFDNAAHWDLLLLQSASNVGCQFGSPATGTAAAALASRAAQPDCAFTTNEVGCMGSFDEKTKYCGPGSSALGDTPRIVVGNGSCINPACYCHDACNRQKCIAGSCQFVSTTCDIVFFSACKDDCSDAAFASKSICFLAERTRDWNQFICNQSNPTKCAQEECCKGCSSFTSTCDCSPSPTPTDTPTPTSSPTPTPTVTETPTRTPEPTCSTPLAGSITANCGCWPIMGGPCASGCFCPDGVSWFTDQCACDMPLCFPAAPGAIQYATRYMSSSGYVTGGVLASNCFNLYTMVGANCPSFWTQRDDVLNSLLSTWGGTPFEVRPIFPDGTTGLWCPVFIS